MSPAYSGRTRPSGGKSQARSQKRKRDHAHVELLEQAVEELDPKLGGFATFADLPLSEPTRVGLKACRFKTLTDVQAKAIPLALKGYDVLGAAKTGSGKTLAFLIPVLENLYREQCIGADAGLSAIVIAPTRELAIQIFDVLYKIGRHGHMFAAGLVIGGKSLAEEKAALLRMNIVVCTPGRILQHLSQTSFFNVDNVRMLVLDEADRILDMGFQHDVDAILDYLPKEGRQTLLFSATQTRRVSDLARLSLKDPEYVSVHEAAPTATPTSLHQNYIVTPIQDKLDTLWSFLQTAKKSKTLVFLSSGKQVRFVYEAFCALQPGVPLLHLHGRQKQTARLGITQRFAAARTACLFATDVAARGLDFPAVDWVVQVDCPEDADTYIHRAGRTARFEREGRAVLFLTPSEEPGMLERLTAKRVPIERVGVRQRKQASIRERLQLLCFRDASLKYLGQKAFLSHVRSIQLQKDKTIFREGDELSLEEFAASLGLRVAPRIKSARADPKTLKNRSRQVAAEIGGTEQSEGIIPPKRVRTKVDRMFERKNQDVLAEHYRELIHSEDENSDNSDESEVASQRKTPSSEHRFQNDPEDSNSEADDNLLTVKRRIRADPPMSRFPAPIQTASKSHAEPHRAIQTIQPDGFAQPLTVDSNRRAKLLTSKKALVRLKERGKHLVFDEDTGEARPAYELGDETRFKNAGAPQAQRSEFVDREGQALRLADEKDRLADKERRREKKERRKARERMEEGTGGRSEKPDEDEGGERRVDGLQLAGDGGDALSNFLADADSANEESEDSREHEESKKEPRETAKKWFQKPERPQAKNDLTRTRETWIPSDGAHTLEDLEAAAVGLLG